MTAAVKAVPWRDENRSLFVGGMLHYALTPDAGPFLPLSGILGADGSSVLTVNPDGSINITGSISVVSSTPTYVSAGAGEYGLSVGGAAVALSPPAGAKYAHISVSGAAVRYKDDGGTPTASSGIPVSQGASWFYQGPLSAIKFIAQSGTATLDVSYYK